MRPKPEDSFEYFEYYIGLVKEDSILLALKENYKNVLAVLASIPEEKANFIYAENKWTIKQVINHIIDTERIFCYRALRFSRGDNQMLLPYDENLYAKNAVLNNSTLALLTEEFDVVRKSTLLFYKQLTEKELSLGGQLQAGKTTVLALGFTICGHAEHHLKILKERYFI